MYMYFYADMNISIVFNINVLTLILIIIWYDMNIDINININININVYIYIHIYIHTYERTYVCTYVCTYVYIYIYAYTCTYRWPFSMARRDYQQTKRHTHSECKHPQEVCPVVAYMSNAGGWRGRSRASVDIWGFPKMRVPQNGWFVMENLIPISGTPHMGYNQNGGSQDPNRNRGKRW